LDIPDVFLDIEPTIVAKFKECAAEGTAVKAGDFDTNDTELANKLVS